MTALQSLTQAVQRINIEFRNLTITTNLFINGHAIPQGRTPREILAQTSSTFGAGGVGNEVAARL